MSYAVHEAEFILRSPHRVNVLHRLGTAPCRRHELHDELGIPQSTLGRVLGDFDERGWIRRDGDEYELTWLGVQLTEKLDEFLDAVETIHRLRGVSDDLPTGAMDLDIEHLTGATVTTASNTDVGAVVRRIAELARTASTLRFVMGLGSTATLEMLRKPVVEDDQRLEAVLTDDVLDGIGADPEQYRLLSEILESGHADVYRFDGEIPYVMGVRDERDVGICAIGDDGLPTGVVETDDERVRSWVEAVLDDYRRRATPL